MTVILVPYHLDGLLPDLDVPAVPQRLVAAPDLPTGDVYTRVAGLYDALAGEVATAPGVPVVVTGDCLSALGVVAGLQRRGVDPAVVWFDAHGDLHTPDTTTSGYVGGMPLRMLIGDGDRTIATRTGLRPTAPDRVVLVDGRDLDPAERAYLDAGPVRQLPVDDLTAADLPAGPLYLHVDLDVVDPDEVPGLRFPAPGGPSLTAVGAAARRVLDTGRVAGMTLACTWHPGHQAATATEDLVDALLGDM